MDTTTHLRVLRATTVRGRVLPTFLRLWRRMLKTCLGCGDYPRLPGRRVCQKCALHLYRAFPGLD